MLHISRMSSKSLEGKRKLSQKIEVTFKAITAIQGVFVDLSLKVSYFILYLFAG